MSRLIHRGAGLLALLAIASFWLSTVISELFASQAAVVAVKSAIPWGLIVLIPALAATGASGFALAGGRRQGLAGAKRRRMPFIAANGLLVLAPAALFLASRAQAGRFDTLFHAIQAVELAAGAINITLLALNARDGLRMTRQRRGRTM